MSLLILEQTGLLRHSTACRHLYTLALSKFDIAYALIPSFWFYKRYYLCH